MKSNPRSFLNLGVFPCILLFLSATVLQTPRANADNSSEIVAAGKYPKSSKSAKSAKAGSEAKAAAVPVKKEEEKPFAEIVKDMEVIKGLFTFYRKADENKVYMEILPDQLNTLYLFSGTIDQSVGERGLYSAQMGGTFPFMFRQAGKNIQWALKNTTFTATNGTPAGRSTDRSFPNGLLGVTKILSQPQPERKSLLINISDLLVTDLPGFAAVLKETYKPSDYRFDRANSAIVNAKAFPENVLFELSMHYICDNPKTGSATLPDVRSVPLVLKYDFSAIRQTGYKPRLADDRVGHFLTAQEDLSSDRPASPFVRRIHRWQLEKADPAADLSAPKQPIVFWLENTIPVEYRDSMREGALLWNKAFEKIGFKDAIVVKQQPDNADWDPADSRYSTIRWFAGVDAAFAIGPSRANPFTGQIYDADISFSEGIVRSVRREADEFFQPTLPGAHATDAMGGANAEAAAPVPFGWCRNARYMCDYADGLAQQAAFGVSVLDARGNWSAEVEQKLMHEYLVEVTAHEVGHTLGLRHNFRASSMLNPAELMDIEKTSKTGQSGSVMDYNPLVIAPEGKKQGNFVPVTLGPYDYWAIEYAYKPCTNESVELAKIAGRSAEPQLAYGTDEDAMGTYSASSIDPLANQFDQSSDPLGYFETRVVVINELWANMEKKLVRDGEGYQILRRSVGRGLNEYYRSLVTGSKFIGGIYHYRDHAGEANGRSTFVPVPADKQRAALGFLQRYAFSETAFNLSAEVLNKLAPDRLPGIDGIDGMYNTRRVDYPWHDSVLWLQRAVLNRLYEPVTLSRIQDNELRFEGTQKPFTMADLFTELDTSIWSELSVPTERISSLRRNLQREHMKQLTRLTLRTNQQAPEDATSLARASLTGLSKKLAIALRSESLRDVATRAHLQETHDRISAVLQAQVQKPWD